MKALALAAVLLGLLVSPALACPPDSRAEPATPPRWAGDTVTFYFNPGGYEGHPVVEDMTVEEMEAAVIAGLEEWNGWASVRLVYGGLTILAPDEANRVNVIAFGPNDVGGIGAFRAHVTDGVIVEVDITLRPDMAWHPRFLGFVVAHEAGHGLGLGHTTTHPCNTRENRAIMCDGYVAGWDWRIHADDVSRLRDLYPPSFAR